MIEPVDFYSNPATRIDNHYQQSTTLFSPAEIQEEALGEFRGLRALLEKHGVQVQVFKDVAGNDTPDSIFPNNWFSTHADSILVLYAMRAESRRRERRADIVAWLRERYSRVVDFSLYEKQGLFLEGTGSLVLDRVNRLAYANLSPRTDEKLVDRWAGEFSFKAIKFRACDMQGRAIYHTNVMMSIGSEFAVVSLESVKKEEEREVLRRSLLDTGHQVIEINPRQVGQYCGNMLELSPAGKERVIVMSSHAYRHFEKRQLDRLQRFGRIICTDLSTIEMIGGGSARCMLAELF